MILIVENLKWFGIIQSGEIMGRKITKKEFERRAREKREFKRSQAKIKKLRKLPKTPQFTKDIRQLQKIGLYTHKKAKKIVFYSPKYASKRAIKNKKELLHFGTVQNKLRGKSAEERDSLFRMLQQDYEFYS